MNEHTPEYRHVTDNIDLVYKKNSSSHPMVLHPNPSKIAPGLGEQKDSPFGINDLGPLSGNGKVVKARGKRKNELPAGVSPIGLQALALVLASE
ncbi:hypothetical protein [Sabulibacter ruber]|uniref:hypothetical protein n=1 Tax=Sabulibacter ruber TaxID=2811901 RepID=UPI001A973C6D|nr:hypothetical protein [Sabulibacter ruber]